MLKELPTVGQKVVYLGGEDIMFSHGMEVGGIYEVVSQTYFGGHATSVIKVADGVENTWFIYGTSHGKGNDLDKYMLALESSELKDVKEGDYVTYLGGDPNYFSNLKEGKAYEVIEVSDRGIKINEENDYSWLIGDTERNVHCFYHLISYGEEEENDDGIADVNSDDNVVDSVNSPTHYNSGKFETIDIIEHIVEGYEDNFASHCIGTVVKYLDRAPFKHESPIKCLEKSQWYLEKAIEALRKKEEKEEQGD